LGELEFDTARGAVLLLEIEMCDFEASEEMTIGPLSEESEMTSLSDPGGALFFLTAFVEFCDFKGLKVCWDDRG
jgi:hypothetical protein